MNQNLGGYGPPPPQGYPQQGYPYGPPPPPRYPTGPRDHPSAGMALAYGVLGVFCLGVLMGAPAIITGRKAVGAIGAEPQRWRGEGTAKVAIALGWLSVVETGFVLAMLVARGIASAIFVMVLALSGLGLVLVRPRVGTSLPAPIAAASGTLRKAPLAVGLPLVGILAGGVFGLLSAIGAAQGAARLCTDERAKLKASSEDFAAARVAIDVIERKCNGTAAELAAMRHEVDTKEADAKRQKEEAERERQAQLMAEKEKSAVANFPEKSKSIAASIRTAQSKASQGMFEASEEALQTAERTLDDFKGTSVEQTKEYADLAKQVADNHHAIQPQLDRIAEKHRKEEEAAAEKFKKQEAAEALKDAIRGPKPVNSAWDGSVPEVERYLKSVMNDPSSYAHVETTAPVADGDYWIVFSSFRGKNAFGALVLNTKKFYIQQRQVVKTADVN